MAKRSDQLFAYLVDIAVNIQRATAKFENEITGEPNFEKLEHSISEYEQYGDELVSKLLSLLNTTYITPLDREDFVELAVSLDDIIDGLHACSVRLQLYNVQATTPTMIQFMEDIRTSANEIEQAIQKLKIGDLVDIRHHLKQLNLLEKRGDQILHEALRRLFAEHTDALEVIKLKEIYEILENVTDRCEDVADVLESVILKNA